MITTEMGLAELLPAIHALSRADKLRMIQHLAMDLAQEECSPMLEKGVAYPIWTPLEAYQAANVLMELLETEKAKGNTG